MRFLADAMLGKLARKLRMLGLDVADAENGDDARIRYRVRAEGRTLLTRDRALSASLGNQAWLVAGDSVEEELASIAKALRALERSRPMTRCIEDNSPLEECAPRDAAANVPPHVLATRDRFLRCPLCERVYWAGTHAERMEGEVAKLMKIIEGNTNQ